MFLNPDNVEIRVPVSALMGVLGLAFLMPLTGLGDEQPATREAGIPVAFSAEISSDSPRLRDANDGTFFIRVKIENTSEDEVVLWPFLSAQLVDAEGAEVPASLQIGRWGLRRGDKDSLLEEIEFVALEAGKTHEFDVRLNRYVYDSRFITGWDLSEAGDYRLDLHYVFDRDQVKESFGEGCRVLDDAEQDWNRALEIDDDVEVSFTVK